MSADGPDDHKLNDQSFSLG